MPQPTYAISGNRIIAKFGGQAYPVTGATMAQLDINDLASWFLRDVEVVSDRRLAHSLQALRSRSVFTSDDFAPKHIRLNMRYIEASTPIAAAKAQLSQAGEQWLTFDNLTQIGARLYSMGPAKQIIKFGTYQWDVPIDFICRVPWMQDIAASTISSTALAGSTGAGTVTTFNTTYAGSVWAEPIWTLTIPNTNTVKISSFVLSNTTATPNETLTLNFNPHLSPNTAYVITIDSGKWTVQDVGNNLLFDFSGSFPQVYGPPTTVNNYSATVVTESGTSSGITLSASWNNRWEF